MIEAFELIEQTELLEGDLSLLHLAEEFTEKLLKVVQRASPPQKGRFYKFASLIISRGFTLPRKGHTSGYLQMLFNLGVEIHCFGDAVGNCLCEESLDCYAKLWGETYSWRLDLLRQYYELHNRKEAFAEELDRLAEKYLVRDQIIHNCSPLRDIAEANCSIRRENVAEQIYLTAIGNLDSVRNNEDALGGWFTEFESCADAELTFLLYYSRLESNTKAKFIEERLIQLEKRALAMEFPVDQRHIKFLRWLAEFCNKTGMQNTSERIILKANELHEQILKDAD